MSILFYPFQERIDFIESEIQEITRNARNLKSDYLSLLELKILIEKTQTFFQDHSAQRKISANVQIYNNDAVLGHLGFIAGTVATSRVPSFERMLWRISHGNIFFKQAQIDELMKDPVTVRLVFNFQANLYKIARTSLQIHNKNYVLTN